MVHSKNLHIYKIAYVLRKTKRNKMRQTREVNNIAINEVIDPW